MSETKPLKSWGIAAWGQLLHYAEPSARQARAAASASTGEPWEWLQKHAGYRVVRIQITETTR